MKRHLKYAAPLLGLSLLLPAAAADAPMVECDTDAELLEEGQSESYDGMTGTIPDPNGDNPTGQSQSEIVTVAGTASEEALKVSITATMSYDVPGDLELRAFDADGNELGASTNFNPQGENIETLTLTLDMCEEVTFVSENYAGVPNTPVVLDVEVEGKYPRKR